jgi:cleavage and polyadenylation specificity factor subunit 1
VEETSGTLILVHSFPNLAGSVCFLETLSVDDDSIDDGDEESFDSLIIGFSGHPRLVVAAVASSAASSAICASPTLLLATSLLDLTAALVEHSLGSVSPLEHDLIASIKSQRHQVTLCVVLGNGVAVATISLRFSKIKAARSETTSNEWQKSGWIAGEPYLLPLANLQRSLHDETFDSASRSDNIRSASLGHAISTGFGDILSAAFLPGYLEPTVVLLHSNPVQGRTWSGRLGRPNGSGGARGCLLVTAIIVTVPHRQSALLWSIEVPTDAISLHPIGTSGVLVVSVNSILVVTNSGRIDQMIAVNGWARSGCPTRLLGMLLPNPWPFPKLAIQLDGARLCMVSDKAGFVALRNGQLYLLQKCDRWSLTPIGQTLGAIGEIAALLPWRFGDVPRKFSPSWTKSDNATQMSLGLLFAGSRLGDSHLLGYVLESNVSVVDFVKQDDSSTKIKIEDTTETSTVGLPLQANRDTNGGELDREGILLLEEAALYAADDSSVDTSPHTIPPSDDETESLQEQGSPSRKRQRSMLSKLTVTRSLLALDTITSLGPIGPGCEGPLSPPPSESRLIMPLDTTAGAVSGATAHVFPCGYGSSGGLALVTAPGRDDRSILAEADCLNVECLFSLPRSGLLLLGMSRSETGIKALRFSEVGDPTELDEEATVGMREINLEEWLEGEQNDDSHVFGRANNLFRDATLLAAAEIGAGKFFIVVSAGVADDAEYAIVSLVENDGVLTVSHHFQLTDGEKRSVLLSLTPLIYQQEKGLVSFCCLWNSGNANAVSISADSIVWEGKIRNLDPEGANQSPSFFESLKVVAVDLFEAPVDIFSTPFSCGDGCKDRPTLVKSDDSTTEEIYEFDDDDFELYGTNRAWSHANEKEDSHATVEPKRLSLFVAICRQSGKLEVYSLTDIQSGDDESPLWFANGCGHGVTHITSQKEHRKPVVHEVHTCEMRFFSCGPSPLERTGSFESPLHSLALLIETSDEDLFLYKAEFHQRPSKSLEFRRVPLGMVSRRSQEQTRHHAKLRRKAIVGGANVDSFDLSSFRHSRLHRFTCLSGQDGAFAAVSRPLWILSERGKLTPLCHRTRHAAPAGGRPWPVVGFCPEVPLVRTSMKFVNVYRLLADSFTQANSESSNRAFMTLHERVGRVGSQRLTIFRRFVPFQ